ncbi:hypothetical protein PIB30_027394 [Stylosanthes scabra]|uniref:Uncharacterized protein n=1 Tax=Stylosanthes scabra TaxID=79078 RepID=A0ABU6UBN6_9FABA|nr:hypothetical protein [Stylosanthes scabra]
MLVLECVEERLESLDPRGASTPGNLNREEELSVKLLEFLETTYAATGVLLADKEQQDGEAEEKKRGGMRRKVHRRSSSSVVAEHQRWFYGPDQKKKKGNTSHLQLQLGEYPFVPKSQRSSTLLKLRGIKRLNGTVLGSFVRPAVLITDAYNALKNQPYRRQKDKEIGGQ